MKDIQKEDLKDLQIRQGYLFLLLVISIFILNLQLQIIEFSYFCSNRIMFIKKERNVKEFKIQFRLYLNYH